jgi:GNAT superfamily N-acetyltransferase
MPGAIGRIAEMHGTAYATLAGFGVAFESLVAREVAAFCDGLPAGRDGLWLAWQEERIEGCIAIQRATSNSAHLRWFLVTEALRGRGTGRALLGHALGFCRAEASPCSTSGPSPGWMRRAGCTRKPGSARWSSSAARVGGAR